jgi:hypothetical protein
MVAQNSKQQNKQHAYRQTTATYERMKTTKRKSLSQRKDIVKYLCFLWCVDFLNRLRYITRS